MQYLQQAIMSLSILPAAITALVRHKRVKHSFHPFIFLLLAGAMHEILVLVLTCTKTPHHWLTNTFVLIEFLIISRQFWLWKSETANSRFIRTASVSCALLWLLEMIVRPWGSFCSWFIIVSSMVILLYSLFMIAAILLGRWTRNTKSTLLICTGLAVFFVAATLVEIFWSYGLTRNVRFLQKVYDILAWINLITNLAFFLAALWMPLSLQYIFRSLSPRRF